MKTLARFVVAAAAIFGALGAACTSSSTAQSNETCSSSTPCANGDGRTYEACTSVAGAGCRYLTSDGSSFPCASCGDCSAAAAQAAAWCDGGTTDGGACMTATVCASSAKDCAAGQRCNTASSTPVCQALYCGASGSPCGGDSANDLCASRRCVQGLCSGGTSDAGAGGSCCAAGRTGNELGVGQYCAASADCSANTKATVCTTSIVGGSDGFCSLVCKSPSDCGSTATCLLADGGSLGLCEPTGCSVQGCKVP